jgi:hypothetical protein
MVYQRLSDGALQSLNGATLPAMHQNDSFAPNGVATDSVNHFVIAGITAKNSPGGNVSWQLASYTMDGSGNMTTQSTEGNMPAPFGVPSDALLTGYAFSPYGHFFAFGGYTVIAVYTWNPASASLTFLANIQPPRDCPPNQPCPGFHNFTWDRYDHLIATWGTWVDSNAQIQVYSVRASGVTPAPGSPYPLPAANMLTAVDAIP